MYTKFWSGNLKGRDYAKDLCGDGVIILNWISKKECDKLWTGLIWLRIGSSGRPTQML
jgi:hypothetical protein